MRRAFLLLALSFACQTASVEKAERSQVKALLSAYEEAPSKERLSVVEGDIATTLQEIAQDEEENRFYRARAFRALAFYPEPSVFDFLSTQVKTPERLGVFLLPSAIYALSEGFSETRPKEVTLLLTPLLEQSSPVIRESAARQLSGRPSLFATLPNTVEDSVRSILEQSQF